ncbi:MAG: hypothetical protein J6O51_09825 [Bacteroidales bacterium]|nr:hypothetical protein [Bacteroidales bacterium]
MSEKLKYKQIALIAVAVLVLIAGVLMLFASSTLKYGLILIGGLLLGYLVWKAFVKNGREELKRSQERNDELEHQLADLNRQLNELRNSPINVASLTPVLHLAVLNVNTSFTRTYVREDEPRSLSFNGALRAEINADYGVRLEDMRFKYDDAGDTLYVAGFKPGIISYTHKHLEWDLARTVRSRSFLGFELAPVDDKVAEDFTNKMKESLLREVDMEIDERKIREFEWLEPVVARQVKDILKAAVCGPSTKIVELEDIPAEGFVTIDDLYRSRQAALPLRQSL